MRLRTFSSYMRRSWSCPAPPIYADPVLVTLEGYNWNLAATVSPQFHMSITLANIWRVAKDWSDLTNDCSQQVITVRSTFELLTAPNKKEILIN